MSPSDINYDLLRGGSGGDPPDGLHTAFLARAALIDTSKGSALITEWQATNGATPYYWETWFGFAANRIAVTQELLDGLGVDRATLTDDVALENALRMAQGRSYQVRTAAWSGGINTFIEDVVGGAQASADVPIDTTGLDAALEADAQPVPDDDDIPF